MEELGPSGEEIIQIAVRVRVVQGHPGIAEELHRLGKGHCLLRGRAEPAGGLLGLGQLGQTEDHESKDVGIQGLQERLEILMEVLGGLQHGLLVQSLGFEDQRAGGRVGDGGPRGFPGGARRGGLAARAQRGAAGSLHDLVLRF